jgi:hypothetical protein
VARLATLWKSSSAGIPRVLYLFLSDIETVLTQVANHMLHSGDNCERRCSVTLVPKSLRPTGMNEVLQVGQGVEYHQDEKHVPIST